MILNKYKWQKKSFTKLLKYSIQKYIVSSHGQYKPKFPAIRVYWIFYPLGYVYLDKSKEDAAHSLHPLCFIVYVKNYNSMNQILFVVPADLVTGY